MNNEVETKVKFETNFNAVCWVNISADDIFDIFFSENIHVDYVFSRQYTDMHEMSKPLFWEKYEKYMYHKLVTLMFCLNHIRVLEMYQLSI